MKRKQGNWKITFSKERQREKNAQKKAPKNNKFYRRENKLNFTVPAERLSDKCTDGKANNVSIFHSISMFFLLWINCRRSPVACPCAFPFSDFLRPIFGMLKQKRFIGKHDKANIYFCNFIEMAKKKVKQKGIENLSMFILSSSSLPVTSNVYIFLL